LFFVAFLRLFVIVLDSLVVSLVLFGFSVFFLFFFLFVCVSSFLLYWAFRWAGMAIRVVRAAAVMAYSVMAPRTLVPHTALHDDTLSNAAGPAKCHNLHSDTRRCSPPARPCIDHCRPPRLFWSFSAHFFLLTWVVRWSCCLSVSVIICVLSIYHDETPLAV